MTFTIQQREAVETGGTLPIKIDGIDCVVVRADVFDRLKKVIQYDDRELQPEQFYPAVIEAWDSEGSPRDAEDYRA